MHIRCAHAIDGLQGWKQRKDFEWIKAERPFEIDLIGNNWGNGGGRRGDGEQEGAEAFTGTDEKQVNRGHWFKHPGMFDFRI